jgi:predicted nucleic acid-binding protein
VKRCFLDANVIFTAVHNADGNGRALFRLAAQSRVVLVSSPYALEEAARNIIVKYPERAGDLEALSRILAVVDEPGRVNWN